MSTAEVLHRGTGLPEGESDALPSRQGRASVLPVVLASALLLLVLYAVFDHGAVALPVEARIQVALAALAAVASAGLLWTGTLRLAAPRLAIAGACLLAAFATWSGVSVLWSAATDQTWIELNRAIGYVIVLVLAVAVGASYRRALEFVSKGFLWIVLAVTAYGIGQKLLPGVHLSGLFSLNQTGPLPRLQEPLGYWNALALLVAMGVPIALALATDRERSKRTRIGSLVGIEAMLLVIAFSYSRGGLLALALGLAAGIAVSGARLRSLMWLAVAALATIPPLLFGLINHSLTSADVSLGHREAAGGELAAILIASLLVLIAAAVRLLELEQRVRLSPGRARGLGRLLAVSAGVGLVAVVVAMSLSHRGLDGTVSHAWKQFTTTRPSNYDPRRLLSADSENRWVWWKEAAGAFSDRPAAGWGAGSFGVVHLLYRHDTLTVKQPHSVPLQFLAETGIVGALLGVGGLALIVSVAIRGVRVRPRDSDRLLVAALLAAGVMYAVHSLYDWDWDIPGITLPALLLLGVLIGWSARAGRRLDHPAERRELLGAWGSAPRLLWLGGLTVWLCAFALSAVLPSLAASKASSAVVTAAASSSPTTLDHAQSSAALASSLDPLSDAGLRAEATVALHRGQVTRARDYLVQAVSRNPTDVTAWNQLALVNNALGDIRDAGRAESRALALDPFGRAHGQALSAASSATQSATAIPTPLR